MEEQFVIWALENAVKHQGQAVKGAIIGRLLHEDPQARSKLKDVASAIDAALTKVNAMSFDEQKTLLATLNPGFFGPKEERNIFAFFNIQTGEQVISAFPPGPEKYPHIGHAKAALMNHELARQYNGKFYLRFEDTNPELVKQEFYQIILDDLTWLGISWDRLDYASDYNDYFEQCTEKLIAQGLAYVDKSPQDDIRKSRETGVPSVYRSMDPQQQLALWREFKNSEPGQAVVLLKIDLTHKNSTMRDPAIYRVNTTPHARQGTKYRIWPMYDFQNAILDGHLGVTHRLRSKEFEMRAQLHEHIRSILNLPQTKTYEFGRFNLVGVESSGRIIREKIKNGELLGWDDPSLTTLVALRRRGFQPQAIKAFVMSTGITKNNAVLTWDDLYRQNTKIMDDQARRFFFVKQPVKKTVLGSPQRTLQLRMHPKHDLGTRTLTVDDHYYLEQGDCDVMLADTPIRMMENCTITKDRAGQLHYVSHDIATYKGIGKQIIHYVPVADALSVHVIMPDKTIHEGVGEIAIGDLKIGDCVQFERFGNVRLDNILTTESQKTYVFWFTN